MTPYEQIAAAIIQKQVELLGADIALGRARSVDGLVFNNPNEVQITASKPQNAVNDLVQKYTELLGPAGLDFCRATANQIAHNFNLNLDF